MRKIRLALKVVPIIVMGGILTLASTAPVQATVPGDNTKVSVDYLGGQSGYANSYPSMSKDGRYVAFSTMGELVATDNNSREDVFVRDLQNGTIERISVSTSGVQSNNTSRTPVISSDGRFVVFYSFATNLIDGTTLTGSLSHVYIHDRQTGTTEMADVNATGAPGNASAGDIDGQDISSDGRFVVFSSGATNIDGVTLTGDKIFVRDRLLNSTTVLSISSSGQVGTGHYPSMSCDGAFVTFTSSSTNLTANDTNGHGDVFLVQRVGGNYISNLTQAGSLESGISKVSCNGDYVGITTQDQLDSGDTDSLNDSYVYDRLANSFDRVNVTNSDGAANAEAYISSTVTVSDDGRYATFSSPATNLDSIATSGYVQVYMRDRASGTTEIVSKNNSPAEGNNDSTANNILRGGPEISPSGKYIAYVSKANNLVTPDTNAQPDVFLAVTGN